MSPKTCLASCLALFVVVGAGLARADGDREGAKGAYTRGLRLFAASHEAEAMEAFSEALRLDASFPDPFRALGTIRARRADVAGMCLEFSAYVLLRFDSHDSGKLRTEMAKHDHPNCVLEGYEGAAGAASSGTLAPAAAQAVVETARGAVAACAAAGTGTVVALLTVRTDGRVAMVDLRGAPAGKPSGKCIATKLRALRFPVHETEGQLVPAVFVL